MFLPPSQNPGNEPGASRALVWLRLFKPARVRINQRERWRMVLGMVMCIAVVALFAHSLGMPRLHRGWWLRWGRVRC